MSSRHTKVGSEPYDADNLLDRLTPNRFLELFYAHAERREQHIIASRVGLTGGRVLSVGCGWHPGRALFPEGAFHLIGVDTDEARVRAVLASGRADEAFIGEAGGLPFEPATFDVILYRLVMHHVVFQHPLDRVFREASRLLRPGGVLIAIEPSSWHPVGAALAIANRVRASQRIHGTIDDVPLSPRTLRRLSVQAGLAPELHAVTYAWRRLPPWVQRCLYFLERLGSSSLFAPFGHELLLIARKRVV